MANALKSPVISDRADAVVIAFPTASLFMQWRGFFMQFFIDSLIPDEVFDGGVEGGEGVGEPVVEGDFGGDALAVEKESGLIAEEGFE